MLFHLFWFLFCLHGSWWEIAIIWITDPFSVMYCFSLALKMFCFVLFSVLWLWWVGAWFSLSLSSLKFAELLASSNTCPLPNLGNYQPLFLQIYFCSNFFLLSFQDCNKTNIKIYHIVPQLFEALLIFYQTLYTSVFSRLDNFYWLTSKLINHFLSHLHYPFESFQWTFNLCYYLSVQKFPFVSLVYFLFPGWKCLPFHSFQQCSPLLHGSLL